MTALVASEWIYRIEGALHMILGYIGTSERFRHKILRLETGDGSIKHRPIEDENRFICQVFGRYLGEYVDPGELIEVSEEFLKDIAIATEDKRPKSRKEKGSIRMDQKLALIQTDFCKLYSEIPGGTLTTEIKPKCGTLCRSKLVPPEVCEKLGKFTTLIYYLKNYPDEDLRDDTERYSPADLLSGNPHLIEKALTALINRRAHTLRAFREERPVFADFLPSYDTPKAFDPVFNALRRNEAFQSNDSGWKEAIRKRLESCKGSSRVQDLDGDDAAGELSNLARRVYTSKALNVGKLALCSASDALQGILKCQALDFIDYIGAECILNRLIALVGESNVEQTIWDAHFQHPRSEKYTQAVKALSYGSPEEGNKCHCDAEYEKACRYVEQLDAQTAAAILADFLVAGTAKDCSMMISLCEEPPKSPSHKLQMEGRNIGFVQVNGGERWRYSMNVVDLEPKAVSRIRRWADRDRKRLKKSYKVIV